MKSKKSFRLFLCVDLCLLLAAILLFCASLLQKPFPTESGFPMWQRSLFKFFNEGSLELVDRRPAGGGKEVLRVKIQVEENDRHHLSLRENGEPLCSIYCYSEAEERLYCVYTPAYPTRFVQHYRSIPWDILPLEAGENIVEFTVPRGVFAKEGRYGLGLGSLGWIELKM